MADTVFSFQLIELVYKILTLLYNCRLMRRYIKRSMVSSIKYPLHTIAYIFCIVSENMRDLCSAGTASVIIALTDGELNEWQFDTAQREVR